MQYLFISAILACNQIYFKFKKLLTRLKHEDRASDLFLKSLLKTGILLKSLLILWALLKNLTRFFKNLCAWKWSSWLIWKMQLPWFEDVQICMQYQFSDCILKWITGKWFACLNWGFVYRDLIFDMRSLICMWTCLHVWKCYGGLIWKMLQTCFFLKMITDFYFDMISGFWFEELFTDFELGF